MKCLRYIPVLLFALLAAAGCSSDECFDNQNALPLAGFYDSADSTKTVAIDSLEVYGLHSPGDSILWNGAGARNELYLPFKLTSDTTTYIFRYLQKDLAAHHITDTVTFIYNREPRLVSAACGVSYLFTMKEIRYTDLLIDSVSCPFGIITNKPIQNLRIFFRVDHSEDNTDNE